MFQEITGHKVIDIELPPIVRLEKTGGGVEAINKAAKLLSDAKFPVILSALEL